MKYRVSVEGWKEWEPEKRKETVMKFLRSKYPEIENKKEFGFNSSDREAWYGPSEDEREVRMYYEIKKEEECRIVELRNIEWYVNVEEVLKEE